MLCGIPIGKLPTVLVSLLSWLLHGMPSQSSCFVGTKTLQPVPLSAVRAYGPVDTHDVSVLNSGSQNQNPLPDQPLLVLDSAMLVCCLAVDETVTAIIGLWEECSGLVPVVASH